MEKTVKAISGGMLVKCKQLIKGLPILFKGSKDVFITGLSRDSRKLVPGNLFIAQKQPSFDGTKMVAHAVENGAAAILTDIYDPFIKAPQLIYEHIARLVPILAARFYHHPANDLPVVALLGKGGATVASYLLRHLLEKNREPTALLGSIEKWRKGGYVPAEFVTEDIITNQKYLREILDSGKTSAIMEVSLEPFFHQKIEGISFETVIFTGDVDLDFWESRIFSPLAKEFVILCHQDRYLNFMKEQAPGKLITYGSNPGADLFITDVRYFFTKTVFTARYEWQKETIEMPLLGKRNLRQAVTVMAYLLKKGISLRKIAEDILSFPGVPGNMERVKRHIFVDTAKSPEHLQDALDTLRLMSKRPIIVVFGSSGGSSVDRKLLAKTVENGADFAIITTENPRLEDPEKILQEIAEGFTKQRYLKEIDRKKAIITGVEKAGKNAILLIAGHGAEKTQELTRERVAFDDITVAKKAAYKIGR